MIGEPPNPESKEKGSFLHLDHTIVKWRDKAEWCKAAIRAGKSLPMWVIETLNAEAT